MKKTFCIVFAVLFILGLADVLQAERKVPFVVNVLLNAMPLPVSPEGFVDSSDKWLQDSVSDLKKALDGKYFHPNKGFPGSVSRYQVVTDPAQADITITVA